MTIFRVMLVRPLADDETDVYRSIRLEALESDPAAFGSTYEHEAAYDESMWRKRMITFSGRPCQIFVAESGDTTVGIVGIGAGVGSDDAVLWGMWVRSDQRGTGVGRNLVDAAVEWARDQEARAIVLQVAPGNDGAGRFYEQEGFEPIGQSPMRPDDPCSMAHLMRKEL